MPDIVPLLAVIAALIVMVLLAVTVWRRVARPHREQSPVGEPPSTIAGTGAELASARSEIARLTELLQQAPAGPGAVREPHGHTGGRHVEIFVNLSRRLQSLVHREIQLLDALENEVEDPDLLKGLFQVDHLATRIRRHAENLAVLGGSVSRRQWSRPVALTEVLRSAIAEVEQYSRVKLVPPIEGTLPGHAVASVIHLIAELIENATTFAPPHTQVLLRAQQVTSGLVIEVEDRGLGMQRADLDRVNRLLGDAGSADLDELLCDGRIGLYVVSVIARQHHIAVQLQPNIFGGIQAVVVLPEALIATAPATGEPEAPRLPAREHPPLQKRIPLQYRFTGPGQASTGNEETTEVVASSLQRAVVSESPALPPRRKPSPLPASSIGSGAPVEPTPSRPPLPRRRSQTHMAPQLQIGPPRPAAQPPPEHDPGLMASFMNGVSHGETGDPGPARHG